MLFFADTTTRYVERIIEKHIRVSDRKRLAFRAGESCIVDTLENNEVQLSLIAQLMEKIFDRREYAVDSIILRAGASPEGPVRLNERLSRERAWNLQHRLLVSLTAPRYADTDRRHRRRLGNTCSTYPSG